MIIQNYGLHWRRDKVAWGSKGLGNEGHLTGRIASKVKSDHVNFRNQSGIYILQDGFRPLYIGQCGSGDSRLFSRLKQHTRNHLAERWDRFSWFGIFPLKNNLIDDNKKIESISSNIYSVLDHLEGALISITEPPLNRQGPRFGDAVQYKQIPFEPASSAADEDYEDD